MTAADSTSEAFDTVAAAIVAARGADDARKVVVAPGRAGFAVYAGASGLHAVLSPAQPLDATGLLLHALRAGAERIRVSVLALASGARLRSQAEALAGVLAFQLSCFSLESSVELVLSATESVPVEARPTLEARIGTPELGALEVAMPHREALVSRYGLTFLEHLGIPYAKVQDGPLRLRPGVSEAENELLEAADPALQRLASTLEHVRATIQEKRTSGGYGPIAVELRSRWLASELLSQPEVLEAESLERVDVVRFGALGAFPFGDLAPIKGGFWGTTRDAEDFLLAANRKGAVLWGIAASMDPGVVVRAAEVAATLEPRMPGIEVALAVSTRGIAVPYLKEMAALAKGGAKVVVLSDPSDGPLVAKW